MKTGSKDDLSINVVRTRGASPTTSVASQHKLIRASPTGSPSVKSLRHQSNFRLDPNFLTDSGDTKISRSPPPGVLEELMEDDPSSPGIFFFFRS